MIMYLFFLSGALFSLIDLPGALKFVTTINPLSYGVDGIREALTGTYHLGLINDLGIILVVIGIITAIGSYLFSRMEV